MTWTLLVGVVLALLVALCAALARRAELVAMRGRVHEREQAVRKGSDQAQLQHPVVDLSRCLGCGTCVTACPEDDVLRMIHGQAVVVNGSHCVGVAACERECPVGAITVTIANLEERDDIPALSAELEAEGAPNVFLAGEVTAHALIKNAIEQGTAVAAEVAHRVARGVPSQQVAAAPSLAASARTPAPAVQPVASGSASDPPNGLALEPDSGDAPATAAVLDLCIVGAGPAGIACSLEAKRHGLSFVTLDQEPHLGGTVAKYPRRKLVMTQPVDLPLYGRLRQTSFTKEELMELWQTIAREQELPIRGGEEFEDVTRDPTDHHFLVRTKTGVVAAHHVCLAVGRRGTPNQLGVPGEDLPKVAYSLLDAASYHDRRILVVGGGDSAVEAAMGLAEQPGNEVTIAYRRADFFRIRSKNQKRLEACIADGSIKPLFQAEVQSIRADSVDLDVQSESGAGTVTIANDDVFIMAGGTPPFELLKRSGVQFGGGQSQAPLEERGTGLLPAAAIGLVLALMALAFAVWNRDYYGLPTPERPAHAKHSWLRPSQGFGLWMGITATALVGLNLVYLLRRSGRWGVTFGSLQAWMTSHVATGILAFLCAALHAAMAPRETVGGQAFWALAVLLVTGAIGRYFYAYVPRAANGRELRLDEAKRQLANLVQAAPAGSSEFQSVARDRVTELIERRQWRGSLIGRAFALIGLRIDLWRVLRGLRAEARVRGIAPAEVQSALTLAREAHSRALAVAHFEDVRSVLGTWRYLHRWVAVLMILLIIIHVVYALAYGETSFGGTFR